jgi:hypothetical protein
VEHASSFRSIAEEDVIFSNGVFSFENVGDCGEDIVRIRESASIDMCVCVRVY